MKKLFALLGLLTLALSGLHAQDVTAEDRAKGLAYLEKTQAGVIAAAQGLSDAQLAFKPAPERWSVAQVLEHIASAEDMLMGMVTGQVMT
ncbi:MAG TPA: DinB family protein, partial [Lacunisphaera sp.]